MRRFVIGDIHGAHKALIQCFERSGFNRQTDLLICLGDLCDGWPEVGSVFDELLTVRNRVLLLGNHDNWLLEWFQKGEAPDIWLTQGGDITLGSIQSGDKKSYRELLENARLYYVLENSLFVHAGILTDIPLEKQDREIFLWDRSLIKQVLRMNHAGKSTKLTSYDTIYVGHTPTINFNELEPIVCCGVCMMDTGAGWPGGLLTIRDIDTGMNYSSNVVSELYPDFQGR